MDQKELRDKLIAVVEAGLTSKSVASKTGIATDILSRFKNGHVCLCENDFLIYNLPCTSSYVT